MRPLLQFAADGREHALAEAREHLADKFGLTETERKALLPSGRQGVFVNRVAWARVYLGHALALDSPRRGFFKITDRGLDLLRNAPERITIRYLERFPEFVEFRSSPRKQKEPGATTAGGPEDEGQTPEEMLDAAYQRLRADLSAELLNRVKQCSPEFFEHLVVEVLLKMGYGGSLKEAGEAIGASGDEGVDGIINEDRLGLDVIYLQAKRWDRTVGRPEIQKFVGALQGKRARKGVFITTGFFSPDAKEYVSRIDPKVVLIDGRELSELMIDFGVGVNTISTYETKRIDSDFFVDE